MSPSLSPSSNDEVGQFVERLRLLMQGRTEKSFSAQIGINQGTFRRYLDGSEPSKKFLLAIARGTGVSIGWLVAGEGPMRPGQVLLPPPVWEQEKAELEEKVRNYRNLQERLEAGKREIEAGKREIELLKKMAEVNQKIHSMEKGMVKQPPPPPTAGGGVADITLLGLAECGMAGWLLKKPLSVNVICPVGMNPAEDFAVMTTGQSLFYAGIEPGFVCFCAAKSAPRVGDIVYVLKPNNTASLGLVRIRAQGKRRRDPLAGAAEMARFRPQNGEPYILRENRDEIKEMVPVIYVQRRPI